jgi:hypothetical protein
MPLRARHGNALYRLSPAAILHRCARWLAGLNIGIANEGRKGNVGDTWPLEESLATEVTSQWPRCLSDLIHESSHISPSTLHASRFTLAVSRIGLNARCVYLAGGHGGGSGDGTGSGACLGAAPDGHGCVRLPAEHQLDDREECRRGLRLVQGHRGDGLRQSLFYGPGSRSQKRWHLHRGLSFCPPQQPSQHHRLKQRRQRGSLLLVHRR